MKEKREVSASAIINATSGSFDLASDVQTVQLMSLLLAEWMHRWDMKHQLDSLEMACSTMRYSSRSKLENIRNKMKNMHDQMTTTRAPHL